MKIKTIILILVLVIVVLALFDKDIKPQIISLLQLAKGVMQKIHNFRL